MQSSFTPLTKLSRALPSFVAAALIGSSVLGQTVPTVPRANDAPAVDNSEPLVLSVFNVSATHDVGYLATHAIGATRIDTLVENVPMSITVLTRDLISDLGANTLGDALAYSGSVRIDSGANFATAATSDAAFTIRGLQGNAVFRDGFPAQSAVDSANIERVEIIKGPASVFYGNASPGGLVNYVTKQPLELPFTELKATVGTDSFYRGEMDVNQPLNASNTALFRFNGAFTDAKSFRRGERDRSYFLAPNFRWLPWSGTVLTTGVEIFHQNNVDFSMVPLIIDTPNNQFYVPYHQFARDYNSAGANADLTRDKISSTTTLDHTFSSKLSTRLTFNAYQQKTSSNEFSTSWLLNGQTNVQPQYFRAEDTAWALRSDWSYTRNTGPIEHKLVFGAEVNSLDSFYVKFLGATQVNVLNWMNFDAFNVANLIVPAWPYAHATLNSRARQQTDIEAAYASDQMTLFKDRVYALLGVREDHISVQNKLAGLKSSGKQASPQVSVLGKLNKTVAAYASYSTSYTPNPLSPQGSLYAPQRGIGEEVGLKISTSDNRITGTISAFDIRQQNILVVVVTTDPVTQIQNSTTAVAGEKRSRGWDSDFTFSLTKNWQIIANYSHLHAYISKGRQIPGYPGFSPDEGLEVGRAPHNQGGVFSKYSFSGNAKGWWIAGGVNYSDQFIGPRGATKPGQKDYVVWCPAYSRVDAMIGYQTKFGGHPVNLSLKATNLLNREYLQPAAGVSVAAPREINATVGIRF